jgi:tRNA 2-thiouridine synthesizing protein A
MAQDGNREAKVIDARGLNCPLPVLRLRKYLLTASAGVEVELLASDRAALRDVPAFCEAHGHTVRTLSPEGPELRFLVTVGGAPNA